VSRRHPNVVNTDEMDWSGPPRVGPPPFKAQVKRLASVAGGRGLGANLFRVPAGSTAVPLHAHHANEEAIYVLEGKGTLRLGGKRIDVRAGDWITLLPGADYAHQLLADRGDDLLYLCMSTMLDVEVVTYPDSGKILAAAGPPGPSAIRAMFRAADGGVDYFEGEGDPAQKA
jgi:uncharacterized cupin superfamily protein